MASHLSSPPTAENTTDFRRLSQLTVFPKKKQYSAVFMRPVYFCKSSPDPLLNFRNDGASLCSLVIKAVNSRTTAMEAYGSEWAHCVCNMDKFVKGHKF